VSLPEVRVGAVGLGTGTPPEISKPKEKDDNRQSRRHWRSSRSRRTTRRP